MQITQEAVHKSSGIKFIAHVEGQVAGRAYLYFLYNDLHAEPFGFLEDVFVEENFRKLGVGSALVKAAVAGAKNHGCHKLICTSRHSKKELHEWYKRFGFSDHGIELRINF